MGKKLAANLLEQIEASKKTTLARFLNALGMRHVGEATAEALEEHFGSVDKLAEASLETLQEVPDVGPRVAESIVGFFEQGPNRKIVDRMLASGVSIKQVEKKSGPLEGQVVVFTGGLEKMTRDEAKEMVRERGGKTADSISKAVTIVVAGAKAGSKLDKARKLDIRIMDEGAFLQEAGR